MSVKDLFSADPIYLIDGSAFVFRGFYANQSLCRSDGFPTGALTIVARILMRILREEKPCRIAMVLDGRGPTFRHEIFPPYKSQRKATPEELVVQLDPIRRLTKALGIPLIVSEGCEADDCIASLAAREGENGAAVIIGADKDLKQCLRPNIVMWDPAGKEGRLTTLDSFKEETGLEPTQWPDVQAIIGDTADNIPGVPGIGIKGAMKLFADFPTLEAIRDRIDDVPPALRKKLDGHVDAIFLYRQLTTLRTTDCADMTDADLRLGDPDLDALSAIQREFELHALGREMKALFKNSVGQPAAETKSPVNHPGPLSQGSLFDMPFRNPAKAVADTPSPLLQISDISALPPSQTLAGNHVAIVPAYDGISIAADSKEWFYKGPADALIQHLAKAAAMSPATRIVVPDLKAIIRKDHAWSRIPAAKYLDLSIATYLLDPEQPDYTWLHIASQWSVQLDIPMERPASVALAMASHLAPRLEQAGLSSLMRKLELPLAPILAHMEEQGILLDTGKLADFLTHAEEELQDLTARIHEAAGGPFNIRSAQQLGEVLFKRLALPVPGKTGGGQASTAKDALENLTGSHPVVDLLLRYRVLDKLRSTYLEPLPRLAGSDGRIRTTLNQCATATGRLSSSNPNLQNIPVRGPEGRQMRSCFTVPKGMAMISADYSQIELRVLAHMSGDPELISAFRHGEDIHARTAGLLYGVPTQDVTKEQRRAAKTINFGLVYGMGAPKLARELGIPPAKARDFISVYFSKLNVLKTFYEEVKAVAHRDQAVTTLSGRRRLLPGINSQARQVVAMAERQAVNTVIQGSAADIIKMAMVAVWNDAKLRSLKANLLLQIHDELLLEVPRESADEAGRRVAELMQNVVSLSVPLVAEWGQGHDWGEAH